MRRRESICTGPHSTLTSSNCADKHEGITGFAADAEGSARFAAGQQLGLPLSFIVLPVLAAGCIVAAVRWGKVWSRVETGTRLKRRHRRGVCGGSRDRGLLGGKGNNPMIYSEPIDVEGPSYDALKSALRHGLDTPTGST